MALKAAKENAQKLDNQLKAIDLKKENMLKKAKMPLEGLTFNETGVYLNGRTLDDASQVERMEVDVALAIARNPKVSIILMNKGSLYDKAHRDRLDKYARDRGVYVLFEQVMETLDEAQAGGAVVYMEDGTGINIKEADKNADN